MPKRTVQGRTVAKSAKLRTPIEGRWSRKYLRLREQFLAKCIRVSAVCHLCGQPIDYSIPAGDLEAFEVDHYYPVSTHPHLAEDMANFRPSHKGCNGSRGNKEVVPTLGRPSREW